MAEFKIQGRPKDMYRDRDGKHWIITFTAEGKVNGDVFDELSKVDCDIEVRKHRNIRSKNANSYFHVLVGKIADAAGIEVSKAEIKNRMLALYGQIEIVDNKPVYMIVPDDIAVEKWEELHLRATSQTKDLNGVLYRVYMQIRGSHTYDTKEMSTLINGTIEEAKEAGLTDAEIMSTKEREMLEQKYGVMVAQPGETIHPLDKLLEEVKDAAV